MSGQQVTAWIGLGANLDDPQRAVVAALRALGELEHSRLIAQSSLYRTAPVGPQTEGQPDYVNAVAALETSLDPTTLLESLFEIENRFGRQRTYRNAPRTLDLDLLLYGDETIAMEGLHIPHPRMHERGFVLLPLCEVAPALQIPGRGAAGDLIQALQDQGVERIPT